MLPEYFINNPIFLIFIKFKILPHKFVELIKSQIL